MESEQSNNVFGSNSPAPESTPHPIVKKSKASILTVIFGILLLTAVGFIVWQNYFAPNQSGKDSAVSPKGQSNGSTVAPIDTHPITAAVIEKIIMKYNLVTNPITTEQPTTNVYISQTNRAPSWLISGTDKYVDYSDQYASSLSINLSTINADQVDISTVYNEIGGYILSVFETNGLVKETFDSGEMFPMAVYSNNDKVCSTSYIVDGGTSSQISVSCGQKSKYTQDLASYVTAKPFFEAFGDSAKSISVEDMVIKSGNNGYVNTYLAFSNAAHLFYKAPNGHWTYFKSTQAGVPCDEYNTSDLKSAFAFESCFAAGELVPVSQYYNL